jgi:hypothetical protein
MGALAYFRFSVGASSRNCSGEVSDLTGRCHAVLGTWRGGRDLANDSTRGITAVTPACDFGTYTCAPSAFSTTSNRAGSVHGMRFNHGSSSPRSKVKLTRPDCMALCLCYGEIHDLHMDVTYNRDSSQNEDNKQTVKLVPIQPIG